MGYLLCRCWRSMATDGLISAEECNKGVLPLYSRSWEEWLDPFQSATAASSTRFCVAHAAQCQVMAPAWTRYQQTSDAAQLGRDHAGSMESCSRHCLRNCLLARSVDQQRAILDNLYETYGRLVAQAPCRSLGDFITIALSEKHMNANMQFAEMRSD